MGKSTKKTHKPKSEDTNQEKLYILHMDLYGPMRVESVNGKKYILIIVDDYSRFTWSVVSEQTMGLSLLIKRCGIIMKRLASLMKHQLHALYSRMGSLKDRLWKLHVLLRINPLFVFAMERLRMSLCTSSLGPALQEMTPGTISSGLVQKSSSSTSYVPPSRNAWHLLFQPMFDELLNPPPSIDNQAAEVIAPIAEVIPQVDDNSTVKLDELRGILKNKARLVARGYRQEEGIDFEESFASVARL
nr:Gag-Pol polyprotein [Tanacetum cinerariifolium]